MDLPDEREAGLDLHDWETRFQQLEPDLADDPSHGLPELADLVEGMFEERRIDLDDPALRENEERPFVLQYRAGRETSDRLERGEDVAPGDVAAAVGALREVYDFLVGERRAP
jgi:hypothetical protein